MIRDQLNRPATKGVGASLAVFFVFGVVADLIPNPVYLRMVPRTGLDYVFLILTSILAGVYIWQRASLWTESGDYTATGSTIGSFLAFGCPICNKVLLLLLGTSTTMSVFDPLRPLLGGASVLLFAGTIYYQRRQCTTCN